jgi:hypothetical protein
MLTRSKIWKFLCSLKLAIVLASAATAVAVAGSMVMVSHPGTFGDMDRMVLGKWLAGTGFETAGLSWWVFLSALLVLMLGLNTLCCFIDWLMRFRSRWRKTGEYLIHLGFVLVLTAFVWGSLAGFRSEGNRIFVGKTAAVDRMPGYFLKLKDFHPKFDKAGRPVDLIAGLVLLRGDQPIAEREARVNHPLSWQGMEVLPTYFGRQVEGFRFFLPGRGTLPLFPGTVVPLDDGLSLKVLKFLPDAVRFQNGTVVQRDENLRAPAMELELTRPEGRSWQGWYFLTEGIPFPLVRAGVRLWPTDPIQHTYVVLTITRDPGAHLALAGAMLMLAGVLVALVSFYRKRARGDRPEVT